MSFKKYLTSNWKIYILPLISITVFITAFLLFQMPLKAAAAPTIVSVEAMVIYMVIDYRKNYEKYKILGICYKELGDAVINLPDTIDVVDGEYHEIIKCLRTELADSKAADYRKYNAMIEYFSVWVHQIKTPIASMRLLLETQDSKEARRISSELNRIEQYVAMVMTYLRLDSDTNDFVFRRYDINEIVRPCIKKFARDFIGKQLSLEYLDVEGEIVTDSKWFGFVVEQILSNALKYTYEGGIKIFMEDDTLVISDTGIGISPEDLPRVFEKSYTGYNGRKEEASSGIGLYLCKRVCDSLGIKLQIKSEIAQGTSVYIGIGQKNIDFKD